MLTDIARFKDPKAFIDGMFITVFACERSLFFKPAFSAPNKKAIGFFYTSYLYSQLFLGNLQNYPNLFSLLR